MPKYEGNLTAFPAESIEAQSQGKSRGESTPGHDHKMKPAAIWTQLEEFDDNGKPYLREYTAGKRLQGKAALITGGDSGIGRSVACLFAMEGCDSTISFLPEEEKDANDTKEFIEGHGRKCHLVAVDLREEDNCKKVVDEHIKTFGRLDVLVNNAARQSLCDKIEDIDLKDMESTFRLNVFAMFAITKFAVPHMKRGSSIINSTSVAAYMGNPTLVDYSATKGAIRTFTVALAQQLASRGIRVNGIAPGIIYTPLQPASNPPENMDSLGVDKCPMGRPGMPVECGVWYVMLASAEGSYLTGQIIHPNGGIEMQS